GAPQPVAASTEGGVDAPPPPPSGGEGQPPDGTQRRRRRRRRRGRGRGPGLGLPTGQTEEGQVAPAGEQEPYVAPAAAGETTEG
ncbi:MAG TPA: hypothetical protein VIM76_10490, partial [Candidatus Dormibacteraeota bacterium]